MYVVYCQNKPRSEFIVIEYENFFEVSRCQINSLFRGWEFQLCGHAYICLSAGDPARDQLQDVHQ